MKINHDKNTINPVAIAAIIMCLLAIPMGINILSTTSKLPEKGKPLAKSTNLPVTTPVPTPIPLVTDQSNTSDSTSYTTSDGSTLTLEDLVDTESIKRIDDTYSADKNPFPTIKMIGGVPMMKPYFTAGYDEDERNPDWLDPHTLEDAIFLNTYMPLRDIDAPAVSPKLKVQYTEFTPSIARDLDWDKFENLWAKYEPADLRKAAEGFVVSKERDTRPTADDMEHAHYLIALCFNDYTMITASIPTNREIEPKGTPHMRGKIVEYKADADPEYLLCANTKIKFTDDPYTGWALMTQKEMLEAPPYLHNFKHNGMQVAVTCLSDKPFENLSLVLDKPILRSSATAYLGYYYPLKPRTSLSPLARFYEPACHR